MGAAGAHAALGPDRLRRTTAQCAVAAPRVRKTPGRAVAAPAVDGLASVVHVPDYDHAFWVAAWSASGPAAAEPGRDLRRSGAEPLARRSSMLGGLARRQRKETVSRAIGYVADNRSVPRLAPE